MLASQRPVAVKTATGLRQCQSSLKLNLRRFSSNLRLHTRQTLTIQQSSLRPSLYKTIREPLHLSLPSLLRYKSTAPEILNDTQVNAVSGSSNVGAPGSFDSFSDQLIPDNIPADISSPLTEYTNGYLHSLGINHGWGPTSVMQWLLEHVHALSGTEWPASLILSAVAFRLLTFPVHYMTSNNSARIRELTPLVLETNNKIREASASGDLHTLALLRSGMKEKYRIAKCHPIRGLASFLLIPFAYGNFILIRHMCTIPVPGLETQGFLWLSDLTSVDPTYTLPLISAACLSLTFKLGGEDGGAMPVSENLKKMFRYGLPAMSFAFMSFMPSALTIHFATVSCISLLQAYLLRNETFRTILGLYPYKPIGIRTGGSSSGEPAHDTVNTLRLAKHAKREIKSQQQLIDAKAKEAQAQSGIVGMLTNYAGGSSGSALQSTKNQQAQKKKARAHETYEKRAAEQDEQRKARARRMRDMTR